MKTFLPYYEEIKLVGHAGCAYVASIIGAVAMLASCQVGGARLSFSSILAFSLLASGALWILPFLKFVPQEYSEYISLGILFALLPTLQIISRGLWKSSIILWLAYSLAQLALFLVIYYNI